MRPGRVGSPGGDWLGIAPPEDSPVQLDLEGEPLELIQKCGMVLAKAYVETASSLFFFFFHDGGHTVMTRKKQWCLFVDLVW